MTLPRHTSFTSADEDAEKQQNELEREHEDIAREFAEGGFAREWRPVVADGTIVAAGVNDAIICYGVDITVRPPHDPDPGDCFRVIRASTGNITVQPDDGNLVQAAAADVLNISGFREYQFANGSWWAGV